MSSAWADGRTRGRAWRRIRSKVLAENLADPVWRGGCHLRIRGVCTGAATTVHHVLGVRLTRHDPKYLTPACMACNLKVGDPMSTPNPPPTPRTTWA